MDECRQRARLRAARQLASGLLLVMGVLFIVARLLAQRDPVWRPVVAFTEAALVGGLADWFAVTALFRHPLGLKIPHTAILPTQQDRLADGMASFLEQHFLTPAVLQNELRPFSVTTLVLDALSQRATRRRLTRQWCRPPAVMDSLLHSAPVRAALLDGLRVFARQHSLGPALAALLRALMARQRHQQGFTLILQWAAQALQAARPAIYRKLEEKSPRWMPDRVNEAVFVRLLEGCAELIEEAAAPDSAARQALERHMRMLKVALRRSPVLEDQLQAELGRLLDDPQIVAALHACFNGVSAQRAAQGPRAAVKVRQLAERLIAAVVTALSADRALCAAADEAVRSALVALFVGHRSRIADTVRQVISGWDPPTVGGRIELYVGRDLQFIRLSGTLVGGLVGLLLFGLTELPLPLS